MEVPISGGRTDLSLVVAPLCGVPPESIFYIKELEEIIYQFKGQYHQYVLYTSVSWAWLVSIGWMGENRLKLNPMKTELLFVHQGCLD